VQAHVNFGGKRGDDFLESTRRRAAGTQKRRSSSQIGHRAKGALGQRIGDGKLLQPLRDLLSPVSHAAIMAKYAYMMRCH
jgi:hypothetical protein